MLTIIGLIVLMIGPMYLVQRKSPNKRVRRIAALILACIIGLCLGMTINLSIPNMKGTYNIVPKKSVQVVQALIDGKVYYANWYTTTESNSIRSIFDTISPGTIDLTADDTRTATFYDHRLKKGFWYVSDWPFVQMSGDNKPTLHLRPGDPPPTR